MKMERKLKRKICLIFIKYLPWVIGLYYLVLSILSCYGINLFVFNEIFGITAITILLVTCLSLILEFCIWHRLPLYYSSLIEIINGIDYYLTIPLSNKFMLIIYLIIFGVFILIGAYIKNKNNVKRKRSNTSI